MQNKYPLWKNLLLVFIAIVGLVYAIPNIYTEYPVIQVSPVSTEIEPDKLEANVRNILDTSKIQFKAINTIENGVEVSFFSTDAQLVAQDVIKNGIGKNYTVALNLASSTPAWLRAIGAEPMKQGLDLRGGVHFLFEVDIESVINRRYEGMLKNIGQILREANIRYSGLRYLGTEGINIRFKDIDTLNNAFNLLKREVVNLDFIKSKNSLDLIATFSAAELNKSRQDTIEQTMSILRNRVNALGVGEAVVQQQGANRIAVDLPGIQDAARAKQILGGTATLQFYLVDQENDAVVAKQTGVIPIGSKLYMMDGNPILLKRQAVLSGDSITSAVSSFDQQTAAPAVQIQLGGGGEALFTKVTRDNIGRHMAIVFVESKTEVDSSTNQLQTTKEERIISAPVIQSALGTNFQITGLTDSKEASNLALLLRAGALPAALYPVEERTVGPSMGKENIRRGIVSLEIGMGLILITMLFYYRFFGLVANIALFLNLVLLGALLSIIGATLTLPGIAGIVLTVGMAVDANVLIYERIREELRHGLSPQAAIYAGYDRAFATIVDANVTTFIVAVILFAIGTGPIRGFAITLSLGLLTSMLTGVTFTRAIVNWFYGGRTVKKLSIGI